MQISVFSLVALAMEPGIFAATPDSDWWSLKPLPPASQFKNPANHESPPTIDGFIRAALASTNLTASPEADRRTLIRRLYFDLTGLPPSPEETDAFINSTDPTSYQQMVDRLLASPRYGERWARHWLDVIHFADTHGFEHDVFRPYAWRFRDYVIESLNRDIPWPQFIREQLAADVVCADQPQTTAALGFLGAGPFDASAAGTAPMSFEYLDRDDLVTQTMAAFVSTTANCARCHAHKFDPISQEDYFALQAVFAGIGKGNVSFEPDKKTADARTRWNALLAASTAADKDVLLAPENQALIGEWESTFVSADIWKPLNADVFYGSKGADLVRQPDGSFLSKGELAESDTFTLTLTTELSAITALRLELLTDDSLPMKGPGRAGNGNMHLSEVVLRVFKPAAAQPQTIAFKKATADFDQVDYDVAKAIDGDLKTSWAIFPKVGEGHRAVFETAAKTEIPPGSKLVVTLKQLQGGTHLIGKFRLSATDAATDKLIVFSPATEAALAAPKDQRTDDQRAAIAAAVLKRRATNELAALPATSKVYAAARQTEGGKDTKLIAEPRVIHVLKRGDLDKPMEEAFPGALTAVTSLNARFDQPNPKDEAARRVALANWLASPENPLTWRSIANRVWHYHFGRGICDTPSDFGRMGGVPSHPELLDWLAASLRDSGGSLKQLHRLICNSAAYKQSSANRDDAAKLDPDNRLLWRMNRTRLDADEFRDAVLSVSGRLDLTMGGPGIGNFKTSPGPQATPVVDYSAFDWDSPGAGRRSVYRVVWRGIADPFMEVIDFPDMGMLTPVRGFSASSLQSLALLNNEFVLRHCEHFAARIQPPNTSNDVAVRAAFRLALLRQPTEEELVNFTSLAGSHGVAAVCRVLFNSNEFLFLE